MLINEIKELLKTAGKYFSKEEELLKNIVLEDTIKMDKNLIRLLLSNEKSKNHFFIEIEGVLIFDKDKFIKFIENKEFLPNSYTAYKNKIGLTDSKGEFIKEKNDVVLSWAYKDCYLEGGQDKENIKKDEIFYNEILAPDEIDRLLEPKVLTNFKKYDANGEHKVEDITMKDNLIIKGNNLLALHSLKEKYAGEIKLIYIDPPYNTGSDSFKYNDRFNHSTWLTFMKNRLEIARELLRNDGFMLVHIDDAEGAYLKILLDEILGQNNFVNVISVRDSHPSGLKLAHKEKTIIKTKSLIYIFRKSDNSRINPHYQLREKWDTHFNSFVDINDKSLIKFSLSDIIKRDIEELKNFKLNEESLKNEVFKKWAFQNRKNIFQSTKEIPSEAKKNSMINKDKVISYYNSNGEREYAFNGRRLSPLDKSIGNIGFDKYFKEDFSKLLCDFWDDIDFNNSQNEGGVSFPSGKKPEMLLARIISMFSNKNDIVLDFFVGSGSTSSVSHKLERKYIGIEQLDYIEDLPSIRLQKVIMGEQSGISKYINWQGGGSFVYCELMKWNEIFIEKINNTKNTEELLKVYSQIKEKAFLNYKFDIEKFEEDNMKNFKNLKIEEQKEIIKKSLDLNSLYVNLSEIDDETYNISEEDKKLNKIFYNK